MFFPLPAGVWKCGMVEGAQRELAKKLLIHFPSHQAEMTFTPTECGCNKAKNLHVGKPGWKERGHNE